MFALCRNRAIADSVAAAMTAAVRREIGGESQTYVSSISARGAHVIGQCVVIGSYVPPVRFVSTRGQAAAASLGTALFDGLAPDGGLYVPDPIEPWSAEEIASLTRDVAGRDRRAHAQAVCARDSTPEP